MTGSVRDAQQSVEQLLGLMADAAKRPVLVGIDGQGGAGESTFARYLVSRSTARRSSSSSRASTR